jgi:RES domain-containing protein
MFANFPPDHENTSGARWNAPEVPAIYTCLDRAVVIAEAEYQIRMQPLRPKARRTVYKIGVSLSSVLNISDPEVLKSLALSAIELEDLDMQICQMVGSGVERMGHDGLLVPSARAQGLNLVVYPNQRIEGQYRFDVLGAEVIDPGMRW